MSSKSVLASGPTERSGPKEPLICDRRSRYWWAQGLAWLAVWWDLGLYFGALINGKWWWAAADFLLFAAAAWTWWLWRYRAPDRDALSNPDRSPSPEAKS